ncbi:MAG: hypothetical protein AAFV33_29560, partial [Chloroflexota bacterium]
MQGDQQTSSVVGINQSQGAKRNLSMALRDRLRQWGAPDNVLLMPAILIILFLSIFPLFVSLFLSFSRIRFVRGGFEINFVGWANYAKIFTGSEQ